MTFFRPRENRHPIETDEVLRGIRLSALIILVAGLLNWALIFLASTITALENLMIGVNLVGSFVLLQFWPILAVWGLWDARP